MSVLHGIRLILLFFLPFFFFGEVQCQSTDTLRVLAKWISETKDSSYRYTRYKKIQVLSGEVKSDTITVVHFRLAYFNELPDTALLTLITQTEKGNVPVLYNCPDYIAERGIEQAKVFTLPSSYLDSVETSKNKPLPFPVDRNFNTKHLYLILPRSLTSKATSLNLISPGGSSVSIDSAMGSAYFDLSELKDGKYRLVLSKNGLVKSIPIRIKTLPQLSGKYYSYWGRTHYEFRFFENRTFHFRFTGHAGEYESKGTYKMDFTTLIINTITEDSILKVTDPPFAIDSFIWDGDSCFYEVDPDDVAVYYWNTMFNAGPRLMRGPKGKRE